MKTRIVILLTFVAATCFAGVRDELAKTKETSIRSWSGIRDAILAIGPTADENLDWRERFMANVCLERLVNGRRRDAFFQDPFRNDPEFDPNWICTAAGYAFEEIPLLEKRLAETNLWYGALEVFAIMGDGTFPHPAFKCISEIIFRSAPADVRKDAARISEEYTHRFATGIDEYASSFVGRLESYILDGTHVDGAATYLRYLASQKNCGYFELKHMVELASDIALLESLIPCFSNRPPELSMIQRRIDQLRESTAREETSVSANESSAGLEECMPGAGLTKADSISTNSGACNEQHARVPYVLPGVALLIAALTLAIACVVVRFFRSRQEKNRGGSI